MHPSGPGATGGGRGQAATASRSKLATPGRGSPQGCWRSRYSSRSASQRAAPPASPGWYTRWQAGPRWRRRRAISCSSSPSSRRESSPTRRTAPGDRRPWARKAGRRPGSPAPARQRPSASSPGPAPGASPSAAAAPAAVLAPPLLCLAGHGVEECGELVFGGLGGGFFAYPLLRPAGTGAREGGLPIGAPPTAWTVHVCRQIFQ
mmetsp:Transcript_52180/g.89789  ORF Transcript_52180/g.89789 Transcript_52180/m.89789 type:complete len:205 (+) Transcript_52180:97-711(+)